jgi:hypothetical protein
MVISDDVCLYISKKRMVEVGIITLMMEAVRTSEMLVNSYNSI